MKKHIIAALAIALFAISCTKENSEVGKYHPTEPSGDGIKVSATLPATIMADRTKSSLLTLKSGELKPQWVEGSTLRIKGTGEVTLSIMDGFSANVAEFSGDKPEGSRFDILYAADGRSFADIAGRDFSGQVQNGNDNVGHISYYAMLCGVDSFEDIEFNSQWAAAHGGTFSQTTCLRTVVELPDGITSLTSIELSSNEAVFPTGSGKTDRLAFSLLDARADGDRCITAWIETPCAEIRFSDSTEMTFLGTDAEGNAVSKQFKPEAQSLYGSHANEFRIGGSWPTGFKKGKGSPSDPYLITKAEDMQTISSKLETGTVTCFRLENDIDMSSITAWTPVNVENAERGIMFDGNGKTISGFRCSSSTYPSMFGVLHGTVRNLAISGATVTGSTNSPCGILCAWAGNSAGTLEAHVENVRITGSTMDFTGTAAAIVGGMCGNACNATFVGCSFEGTVKRSGACTDVDNYVGTGGLVGKTLSKVRMQDCHVSGKVYNAKGRATGGLVGYWTTAAGEGDITGCWTDATVESVNDCTGGLIGWFSGGVFRNNWAENATVIVGVKASGTYAYAGGLLGHSSTAIDLTDCHFTGTIKSGGTITGGIVGQATNGINVQRCWFDGTITSTAGYIGGILSRTGNKPGYVLSDCYSKGSITGTTYLAGIVADTYEGNTIRNCYSTCDISGTYGLGGLVARASNASGSSVLMGGQNFNILVEGIIAWNGKIATRTSGGENPASHYPCGPVVGYTAEKNTLRNCWRKPDMTFNFYANAAYNNLYDQDDVDASHPLYRKYTDKYYFPYNGKAAASGETVSAVASRIGWDSNVWDLSGSEPKLK